MSDHIDSSSATTNLEEVFLSREFHNGRKAPSRARRNDGPFEFAGTHAGRALDAPLERVLVADAAAEPVHAFGRARQGPPRRMGGDARIVAFPVSPSDHLRLRALAAVSSVAAAAIVFALVTSAPGHGGRSGGTLSAAGPASSNTGHGRIGAGGSNSSAPAGGVKGVNAASSSLGGRARAVTEALVTGETDGGPAVTTGSPTEAGPSIGAAAQGTGASNAGAGSSSPAPPAPPPDPSPATMSGGLSGVTGAVGNTVTTVGTTIDTTANQFVSTAPATAAVGGAANGVGATVTDVGQSVG